MILTNLMDVWAQPWILQQKIEREILGWERLRNFKVYLTRNQASLEQPVQVSWRNKSTINAGWMLLGQLDRCSEVKTLPSGTTHWESCFIPGFVGVRYSTESPLEGDKSMRFMTKVSMIATNVLCEALLLELPLHKGGASYISIRPMQNLSVNNVL